MKSLWGNIAGLTLVLLCVVAAPILVGLLWLLSDVPLLAAGVCALGVGVIGCTAVRGYRRMNSHWRMARAGRTLSELATRMIPQLRGTYKPYVLEAAHSLGAARDATAVPALLSTLEQYVSEQPPGWTDVAEAIVTELGVIGDRRALPVLYRLENFRGIGLIDGIRLAISRIEPAANLLRAGSEPTGANELLHPHLGGDPEPAHVLLRSHSDTVL